MNNFSSKKSLLFDKILSNQKEQSAYFPLEAVKRSLASSGITLTDGMLRECMSEAMATGIAGDAGRGWYSRHDKAFSLDPMPLGKLIRSVAKAFPLLDFCCWSTTQKSSGFSITYLVQDRCNLLFYWGMQRQKEKK